jgi:glycosyltransferase involved in cell wall biosynthesis
VHSRYAEERVRATGFSGPIHRIAHPTRRPGRVEPARVAGGPVIGFFGHMTPAKRVPVLLDAFAALRRSYPDARLLVVGSKAPQIDLDAELSRAGLHDSRAVLREDWVPEERLTSLMAACDVCVNLRGPTMGETSGSAVRSLALGRPLVVSDIGWFAELPDEVALKVPPDEFELPTLTAALGLLVGDDGLRRTLGENGAAYALREHDLERVADDYAALLGAERQAIPDDVVSGSTRGLPAAP